MFYKDLLYRYYKLLAEVKDFGEGYTHRLHLIWMIEELNNNPDMSETKKHRWLGYIQGVMTAHEVLDVEQERNATREVFKGA